MTLRALAALARADYLERVRRHGFLVALGVTLYFAYAFLPPASSNVVTLQFADHRGIYDSAWVGCAVAMLAATFLGLGGFFLVKNAIERDRRTGVGQILATTPISKPLYTVGKACSNFAVLATLLLLLAVGAMGMQLLRGEDRHVDALALFAPFVVVTLPVLAVAAAMAVLFEAVPALRGGLGNVVYVFLFTGAIAATSALEGRSSGPLGDFLGVSAVLPSMIDGVMRAFPGLDRNHLPMSMGFSFRSRPWSLETFRWQGPQWTAAIVLGRMVWVAIAGAIALLAAIPFDRFDAASPQPRAKRRRRAAAADTDRVSVVAAPVSREHVTLSAAPPATGALGLVPLVRAEARLMARGMPWPWWLVAAGLALACWLTPLGIARAWLLPSAWIWPLLLWSPLGAREALHRTEALVFSSPRPLARQLAATWIAGALLALVLGAGVGARLALAGDGAAAAGWLVGACFIPSLALACGVWTGNGRMFEVLYLLLWYIGPMNHVAPLDYAVTSDQALAAAAPASFTVATVVLLALAVVGRLRRLRG